MNQKIFLFLQEVMNHTHDVRLFLLESYGFGSLVNGRQTPNFCQVDAKIRRIYLCVETLMFYESIWPTKTFIAGDAFSFTQRPAQAWHQQP